ncbi:hypothetical protein [Micromonospora sp. NPDC047074]|uniref:hypothetical protein n=1 Tax=Micromonospora sp. NPDC047074 TaxID=3154339 RepID=UPI0033FCFAF6
MTDRPFELLVLGTTDEYRLDVVTDPEPDTPQAVTYFTATATDLDAACRQAQRLLDAVDGPADRYGELYAHDGVGTALYCDTIHRPE